MIQKFGRPGSSVRPEGTDSTVTANYLLYTYTYTYTYQRLPSEMIGILNVIVFVL